MQLYLFHFHGHFLGMPLAQMAYIIIHPACYSTNKEIPYTTALYFPKVQIGLLGKIWLGS